MNGDVKLTKAVVEAMEHVARINAHGLGAKFPNSEMIIAANQAVAMGLMDMRLDGRWITPAGLSALNQSQGK